MPNDASSRIHDKISNIRLYVQYVDTIIVVSYFINDIKYYNFNPFVKQYII